MDRERVLAVMALGIVVVAIFVAIAVPGVLADPTDTEPIRPGEVSISDVTIAPSDVSGETATLTIETRLAHRGNPAPNVTVLFRAIDAESGLLETTQSVPIGELNGSRERTASTDLTVEREGGSRIQVIVFQDGQRVDVDGREVAGLEALTPSYARTPVQFTETSVLPPLSVSVQEVAENQTRLSVTAWLTNPGDDPSEDLAVTFVLRQADSNLVADRTRETVDTIRPGRTQSTTTTLTVPSNYNYYIDAILWKDDVMIDTARNVANLNPRERIDANTTTREVQFEVSDFDTDDPRSRNPEPRETEQPEQPGFGVVIAILAIALAGLVSAVRRRSE